MGHVDRACPGDLYRMLMDRYDFWRDLYSSLILKSGVTQKETHLFMIPILRYIHSVIRAFKDHEFRALLLLVIAILATGTYFYHRIERWGWLDSLYFCVTTLSTVGYGDMAPHTDAGKIFTIIYIFLGIGVILAFINVIARHASVRNPMRGFLNSEEKDKKL